MNERLEYQQLECYKLANDMQKEKLNREPYFDLGKLPGKQLQTEFAEYIYYRGTQVSILILCAYSRYPGGGFEKSEPPFLFTYPKPTTT